MKRKAEGNPDLLHLGNPAAQTGLADAAQTSRLTRAGFTFV